MVGQCSFRRYIYVYLYTSIGIVLATLVGYIQISYRLLEEVPPLKVNFSASITIRSCIASFIELHARLRLCLICDLIDRYLQRIPLIRSDLTLHSTSSST